MTAFVEFVREHPLFVGYWTIVLLIAAGGAWRTRGDAAPDTMPIVVAAALWPIFVLLLVLEWIDDRRST